MNGGIFQQTLRVLRCRVPGLKGAYHIERLRARIMRSQVSGSKKNISTARRCARKERRSKRITTLWHSPMFGPSLGSREVNQSDCTLVSFTETVLRFGERTYRFLREPLNSGMRQSFLGNPRGNNDREKTASNSASLRRFDMNNTLRAIITSGD